MSFNLSAFGAPRVDYPTGPYPVNQAGETTVGNISSGNIDLNAPVIGGYQSQPITYQELRSIGPGINTVGVNTDSVNSGVDMQAPVSTNNLQPGFDAPIQSYSLPSSPPSGITSSPGDVPNQSSGLDTTTPSTSNFSYDSSAYGPYSQDQTAGAGQDFNIPGTGGGTVSPSSLTSGQLSGTPESQGQATDFLGSGYSPSATEGLPGPLQGILGGNQSFNLQSPTSSFSGEAPSAQAKTPASTEGQIAEAKATEDQAKSTAKAAETIAKATSQLASQQAKTGTQESLTAAQDTASTVTTNKDIASTGLNTLKDLTQRGFIALFGLILLAGAVYYFSKGSSSPQVRMAT